MTPETVHEVHLDVCTRCASVWFDDGELAHFQQRGLLSQVDDMFVPDVEKSRAAMGDGHACPSCGDVGMDQYAYMYSTPVKIDTCPACHGIWVQDGELRAMEQLSIAASNEPVPTGVQHQIALAEHEAKHDASLARSRFFQRVMRIFSLRRPGW
jgi:Zn-finger nucleic acid-binding protein